MFFTESCARQRHCFVSQLSCLLFCWSVASLSLLSLSQRLRLTFPSVLTAAFLRERELLETLHSPYSTVMSSSQEHTYNTDIHTVRIKKRQKDCKLQIIYILYKYEAAQLFSTLIIFRNVSWVVNQNIRMISEGSCDTDMCLAKTGIHLWFFF